MDRRAFIKSSLLALLSCPVLACSGSGAAAPKGGRGSVLIIGAGMAGLAAAVDLRERGFDVAVVEGRHRVGGRIRTDQTLGLPVDLGASWIHGAMGNPITRLARQLGLQTEVTDYDSVTLYDVDGEQIAEATQERLGAGWSDFETEATALGLTAQVDMSVEQAARRVVAEEELKPLDSRFLQWRLATTEVTFAENLSRVSLLGASDDGYPGVDRLFPGGYGAIPEGLAQGLTLHLGRVVRRIELLPDGVKVLADGAVYEADAVLVTLPLGVLKARTVTFAPGLPAAKRDAIDVLGFGVLNKVALRFPTGFWPSKSHFLGFLSEPRDRYPVMLNRGAVGGGDILVTFTGGDFARSLEPRTDAEVVAEVLARLRRSFGSSVPDPVATVMSRWGWNPMSHGSYVHVPVGVHDDAFEALAAPVGERLFFAGAATILHGAGTVHGAFESGLREADRIASLLQPSGRPPLAGQSTSFVSHPHTPVFPASGPLEGCEACHP